MKKQAQGASWGRRVGGMMAAVALAAAGVVAVAAPAHAAPGDCGSGYTCLYSGYDYGNDWAQNGGTQRFAKCIDNLGNYLYNDKTSSVFNNGRTDEVRLYEHDRQQGAYVAFARNSGSTNLGGWNDRITSAYFATYYSGYVGSNDCR